VTDGPVHVPNDPAESRAGAFGELLRLQMEFQARLAEEALRYLRRLQGAGTPAAPGTVLVPDGSVVLQASGSPGASVSLDVDVENRQRVHCVVTPAVTPLVDAGGVTWFPATESSPASTLIAPGEVKTLSVALQLPADLQPGTYRGALLLQGFREGGVPVSVTVAGPGPAAKPRARSAAGAKKPAPRSRKA
jgi:hypothetical protein